MYGLMHKYFSHGKLLISGEYVVLDGATAFALPTRFGQSLEVRKVKEEGIRWRSLDKNGRIWFEHRFQKSDFIEMASGENLDFQEEFKEIGKRLFSVLQAAAVLNPNAFSESSGFEVTSRVDFPLNWGLGTSSTLISNISKWLNVDAFKLLHQTFKGSGYDVAVALNASPITYQLHESNRSILQTSFSPEFRDSLFFVHLNQKQDSRRSIADYNNKNDGLLNSSVEKISNLTHQIIGCKELAEFELLLEIHENIISQLTGFRKVGATLFPDYEGSIKSLGGWGGDFVLATGEAQDMEYFRRKGYQTVIPFREMILTA